MPFGVRVQAVSVYGACTCRIDVVVAALVNAVLYIVSAFYAVSLELVKETVLVVFAKVCY